jgi:tetraacyldisaccharide-1-P 4'-kinase
MLPKLNRLHYLIDKSKTKEQAENKIKKELVGTDNDLVKLQRGVAHYRNNKTGENTIAIKGTDKTNIKDLISDVKLGLGLSSSDKQFKKEKMILNEY